MTGRESLFPLHEFEYGVARNGCEDHPHRAGMTAEQAETWLAEWAEMTDGSTVPFTIIRRPLGAWERP